MKEPPIYGVSRDRGPSVSYGEIERAARAERVEAARDVELYTEYALYATAIQAQPADTVDLLAALVQQNPKSKYLDDICANAYLSRL